MFDIITALSTNLFRTFIIKKFMSLFFPALVENKKRENFFYFLFYFVTVGTYLAFQSPPANIAANIFMLYVITQLYEGEQKKKILVTILIYGINMICDILSVYSFSNYVVGEKHSAIVAYVTVLLISICEFIIERFFVKNREKEFTPPYWNVLMLIPMISIVILFILLMNNLNNQIILVSVSAGILFINMLIFYLYNALMDIYIKLEENVLFERKLGHDMKHHLNELIIMAKRNGENHEITDYIQNMQMFMENKSAYSNSGNKEVDSILNYMLNKAQEVLEEVEYKINVPKEMEVRLFDLNVILGNLLENAIQAASHSKEKKLFLLMKFEKGMLFIHVRNTYEGGLIKNGKDYLTTKKKAEQHGIGLKNVERVINSYHGNIEISDTDNIFDVKIMLYTLFIK